MPINIATIDAKIRKLQELKRLASDPEMLQILESLVAPSANKPQAPQPNPRPGPRRGEQRNAVFRAMREISGRFTATDIVGVLKTNGFVFAAKSPSIAVNSILRKLVAKGELVVAVQGSGRAGNQYEQT